MKTLILFLISAALISLHGMTKEAWRLMNDEGKVIFTESETYLKGLSQKERRVDSLALTRVQLHGNVKEEVSNVNPKTSKPNKVDVWLKPVSEKDSVEFCIFIADSCRAINVLPLKAFSKKRLVHYLGYSIKL